MKRFFDKIVKTNGCWEWKSFISNKTGYGQFWMDAKTLSAHRASWIIHYGNIPKNKVVMHTCDNRICVNPHHLRLGTSKENIHDMMTKGRKPVQRSKLTEIDKIQLLDLYLQGKTQRQLASMFGVHQKTIWRYIHSFLEVQDLSGSNNHKSKLTKKNVSDIRLEYIPHKHGAHKIAKKYGVAKSTIQRIIKGEIWKNN